MSNGNGQFHLRAFLDSLNEFLPMMISVKNATDLKFVHLNRAAELVLGFSREEAHGKSDFDLFPREQAESFVQADREALAGLGMVEIDEERVQTRERGPRLLHKRKIPICGSAGRPEYLLEIAEDVTDRVRAAKRRSGLLAEVSELDSLERLGPLLVPELCDGCAISILRPELGFETLAAFHRDPALRSILPSPKTIRSWSGEPPSIRMDGPHSVLLVPIAARERVIGILELFTLSASRRLGAEDERFARELGRRAGFGIENALLYQKAQEAIRARDEFLCIASHELKTPITGLKLQVQMYQKRLEKNDMTLFDRRAAERLVRSADLQLDRLTKLIENMLDISRIAHGKLQLEREPVDLRALIDEVIGRFAEQLDAEKTVVKLDAEDGIVGAWDRYRLDQVITNLLTNAMKYGASGPIEISARRKADSAVLVVRDHGIGIAPENHDSIFQRFERAVSSDNISGLGLGLYICRQIVEAHGGQIRVESELRRGSAFTVELPF